MPAALKDDESDFAPFNVSAVQQAKTRRRVAPRIARRPDAEQNRCDYRFPRLLTFTSKQLLDALTSVDALIAAVLKLGRR